jgi:hypothetical protein
MAGDDGRMAGMTGDGKDGEGMAGGDLGGLASAECRRQTFYEVYSIHSREEVDGQPDERGAGADERHGS